MLPHGIANTKEEVKAILCLYGFLFISFITMAILDYKGIDWWR